MALLVHLPAAPVPQQGGKQCLAFMPLMDRAIPTKLLLQKVTTHQLQQMGFLPSNTRTLPEDLEATALSSHEASKVAVHNVSVIYMIFVF